MALAVGPSGTGKWALVWLTAHALRHRVRWYRISRLTPVAGERATTDRVSAVVLKKAAKGGLAAAARVARTRADARMQSRAAKLERRLAEAGYSGRVLRRAGEPESHRWPSDDFLVLVDVPSIFAWQRDADALVELCRPLLEDRVGFFLAPVRAGKVVGSFRHQSVSGCLPRIHSPPRRRRRASRRLCRGGSSVVVTPHRRRHA